MALIGVMVYLDETDYDWLYGQLINIDSFVECEIKEQYDDED